MKYITPLRYPGGKTQLYHFVAQIIKDNHYTTFIESCAGGANLSLSLLQNKIIDHAIINDFDKGIYSLFFNALEQPQQLITKIKQVPFDVDTPYQPFILEYYQKLKGHYTANYNGYTNTSLDLAFEFLFLNRTNYSGIINGRPIGGLTQDGKYKLNCRFNKKTLIKKINLIHFLKGKITLYNQDANSLLNNLQLNNQTLALIDPPYVKQGNSLYNLGFTKEQHKQLANTINHLSTPYIVTYDDDELIQTIYPHSHLYHYALKYSSNNKNKGKHFELMIANSKIKLNNSIYLKHC